MTARPRSTLRMRPRPPGPGRTPGWRWPTSCARTCRPRFPGAIGLFRDIDSAITLPFLTRFPTPGQGRLAPHRPGSATGCARSATTTSPTSTALWNHLATHRAAPPAPGRPPSRDHPGPGRRTDRAAHPDQGPRGPDRRPARRPPRRRDLHLTAQVRHRPCRQTAGRDRRRPRPLPDPRRPRLPGRRRPLDPPVRQGQGRRLPLGRRQTAPRRRHRLRRRLPPRQPLGRRPLRQRARARGHDHPHAVRILARAWLHIIWRCWQDGIRLRPRQTPRPPTRPPSATAA